MSARLALALLPLLVACATEAQLTDPDRMLAEKLELYQDLEDEHGRAEHADRHGGQVLDRQRLRHDIERLATEFPGHPPTLMACALVSVDGGEPERAQEYLDRLFRLRPIHPDAAILRARLALGDGNAPLARRILEQHLAAVPDHPGLYEALAGVQYQAGETPAAWRNLATAESLGAPGWRVAFHRGLLAEAEGEAEQAQAAYRRALELDPAFQPARARLTGLAARGRAPSPAETPSPAPRDPRRGPPEGLGWRQEPPPALPEEPPPPEEPSPLPPQVGPPGDGFWGQPRREEPEGGRR